MNQIPPDISELNEQIVSLVSQFSAVTFCATRGRSPERVLFMDSEQVIALSKDDPRFPYGFFCEIEEGLSESQMDERLGSWLENGEAYQEFIGMNVCRYNC